MAQLRSVLTEVLSVLDGIEGVTHKPLRDGVLGVIRETLHCAADQIEVPRRVVIRRSTKDAVPEKPPAFTSAEKPPAFTLAEARSAFTPWKRSGKSEYNAFLAEMLTFLRSHYARTQPTRDHRLNMAEAASLWSTYKGDGTLEDVIRCAKEAVTDSDT